MSAARFSVGKQFQWHGETYEVRRLLPPSSLTIVNLRTGTAQTVTGNELVHALFAGELRFVVAGQSEPQRFKSGYVDWHDCPETLRAVAEHRLEIIRPLLGLPPGERKQALQEKVSSLTSPQPAAQPRLLTANSVASAYRWLADYTRSGADLRALIPNTRARGGKGRPRLAPEVEAVIGAVIEDHYYVREKRTVDFILREVAVRIGEENQQRGPTEQLTVPSRATVARRLAALNVERKLEAQQGRRAAKRTLAQYGATEYSSIPLARVEIDHTRSDLIVIDEADFLPLGRLTLTYCLDMATRYPLGYYLGFEPPSYYTVMECLYHAIGTKGEVRAQYGTQHDWVAYGIPYTLVVDNGKEFVGHDLADACNLLGIVLQRAPVQTPHFKAGVERMFGTLNTELLHTLPGTTFSQFGQRGDYDSLRQACISLTDLDRILHLFLLDIYAESFHRGLEGVPARHWEEATRNGFFPRVPPSVEELRILLGRVAYRTVQPYGIEFESLRYNCAELAPLRTRLAQQADKRVKLKYQPSDLSRIYVYDPFENRYIAVPALAQEYTQGLSLWKHRVVRHFVLAQQRQVDLAALGEARRRIQEVVEASLRRKDLHARTRVARWQTEGRSSPAGPTPDALEAPGAAPEAPLPALTVPAAEELAQMGWSVNYDLPIPQAGVKSDDC